MGELTDDNVKLFVSKGQFLRVALVPLDINGRGRGILVSTLEELRR
jgi:hypothetical protein